MFFYWRHGKKNMELVEKECQRHREKLEEESLILMLDQSIRAYRIIFTEFKIQSFEQTITTEFGNYELQWDQKALWLRRCTGKDLSDVDVKALDKIFHLLIMHCNDVILRYKNSNGVFPTKL